MPHEGGMLPLHTIAAKTTLQLGAGLESQRTVIIVFATTLALGLHLEWRLAGEELERNVCPHAHARCRRCSKAAADALPPARGAQRSQRCQSRHHL